MSDEDAIDPIAQLYEALLEEGKPTLEWIVRWSRGGADPMAAAWAASVSDLSMRNVLAVAGRSSADAACDGTDHPAFVVRGVDQNGLAVVETIRGGRCKACCDAIRAMHPTPPSLHELMQGIAGTGPASCVFTGLVVK